MLEIKMIYESATLVSMVFCNDYYISKGYASASYDRRSYEIQDARKYHIDMCKELYLAHVGILDNIIKKYSFLSYYKEYDRGDYAKKAVFCIHIMNDNDDFLKNENKFFNDRIKDILKCFKKIKWLQKYFIFKMEMYFKYE